MQSEKQGRRGFSRSDELLNSFPGFGSRRSMLPSLFSGRDPFDDPFFSRPLGDMFGSSMFGPSAASSGAPQSGSGGGIIVEELNSDDEGEEDEGTVDGRDKRKERAVSSNEPSVEHPDDDDDDDVDEEKVKNMSKRSDFNKVQGTQPQGRSVSVQSCRVTYGGIDGAYYTSTRNRRAGNDGVMIEETKEADKTTGQATHKISRGIHDKGHSVTRKLNADGKVDMLQTLHNLNEDELAGFEEAWDGNVKLDVPGWKEFGNQGEPKGNAPWNTWLLPSSEQPQSSRGVSGATSDGRTKKVVRINIE
uniref:myeloid leukemia factor 1 isoform X2 n=1 Tax=Fragaria vesca subsp. vesca TaxID=101020 RepID=UPI0005C96BA5|nr:PREDICTED: myeloid leukemia factor 1 isoform X2 [Fragaria vesca subsp. vesca]XP_011469141.1 PREDICTED: myeloid leukemia factor 1 isoform X2 [Fragaria vesca subsp. vesca]